jgi:hypothetical protein
MAAIVQFLDRAWLYGYLLSIQGLKSNQKLFNTAGDIWQEQIIFFNIDVEGSLHQSAMLP